MAAVEDRAPDVVPQAKKARSAGRRRRGRAMASALEAGVSWGCVHVRFEASVGWEWAWG